MSRSRALDAWRRLTVAIASIGLLALSLGSPLPAAAGTGGHDHQNWPHFRAL